jgi:chromosome segregation ATPase
MEFLALAPVLLITAAAQGSSQNKNNKLADEYNSLVNKFNDLARNFNKLNEECSGFVKKHNEKVDDFNNRYNKLVGEYNDLVKNSVTKESAEKLEKEYKKNVNDYNELVGDHKTLVERYKNLQDKHNDLVDRFNDVNTKYEGLKEKYEDKRDRMEGERVDNARTNTRLQEKLESASAKVLNLTKRLTSSESENNKLLIKLDEKNAIHIRKVEELSDQLITLRLESGEKDGKLREAERELERKNEEIERLKRQGGLSQEELLTEKLRSERRNLDLFSSQFGIDLEQINSLLKYHERLFVARKSWNQTNIDLHEENISCVKQVLLGQGVDMINIQEIIEKCERIAELSWELSQIQEQQFEARQEIPTNN